MEKITPPKLLMGFVFLVELVGSVLEYSGNVSCDAFSDMTVTAVEMLSFLQTSLLSWPHAYRQGMGRLAYGCLNFHFDAFSFIPFSWRLWLA